MLVHCWKRDIERQIPCTYHFLYMPHLKSNWLNRKLIITFGYYTDVEQLKIYVIIYVCVYIQMGNHSHSCIHLVLCMCLHMQHS